MQIIQFLRTLKTKRLTIETKEKTIIKGTLTKIDKKMNIYLTNATIHNEPVDSYFIRGTQVRYVIVEESEVFGGVEKRKCVDEERKRMR
ncbi:Small nuclear ribonucleoprotein SMD1 [Trachipleistophora hominis]|uniref:Small nuclear ribonucleoprotein SMD1 n=1 Tax=Trachipleistophora hominis TaxID=72359 RepID=L7JVY5_TRAHO|nr:Small nuclear ribonucleoprotein SMD1 [Trachipleistophora hominis]